MNSLHSYVFHATIANNFTVIYSVHATSNDNHDLKELQEMLKEENLSKMEKQ